MSGFSWRRLLENSEANLFQHPTRARLLVLFVGCLVGTLLLIVASLREPIVVEVTDFKTAVLALAVLYGVLSLVISYFSGWIHLLLAEEQSSDWRITWAIAFLTFFTLATLIYAFLYVLPKAPRSRRATP